jgi:predicted nucleic acid-binding protein
MQAVLFDTSVYISALRQADGAIRVLQGLADGTAVWLSAVVLEELYAGAGERDRRIVEALERDFDKAKRILVPDLNDWIQVGKVLERLAAKHHYEKIGRGRLTNDALIAMNAARLGFKIITANQRDFRRLAEFRPFQWEHLAFI